MRSHKWMLIAAIAATIWYHVKKNQAQAIEPPPETMSSTQASRL